MGWGRSGRVQGWSVGEMVEELEEVEKEEEEEGNHNSVLLCPG